uniref:Thioredoxin domain-containing protein n=1 Tax=Oryza punctata TaxID=4537 RepID=A0A0E0K0Y6_ORYPU
MGNPTLPPVVVVVVLLLLLVLPATTCGADADAGGGGDAEEFQIPRDGRVLELDDGNFDAAVRAAGLLFVDFYAPWCGHCKRLAPQLDEAAPVLAGLSTPIIVAKVNADKYKKLGSKYGVDGFPTLMLFDHGTPTEYTGSRKADLLVESLKKLVAPDVSVLESDSAIKSFVKDAGMGFPLFLGFGVDESLIVEYGAKYKNRAWFSVAKDFSEDMMVFYDFDKVPALVSVNPKYREQSIFYGPFDDGAFLEDFIRNSLLPLVVPMNRETVKMLNDDGRKVVLTILQDDESDENSPRLIKVLRSAASANRDLVFGYVGVNQWEEFTETFDIKSSELPTMIVWDKRDEYEIVEGSERLEEGDYGSQISRFLEGYRAGRTVKKKVSGRSPTLLGVNAVYILIFLVAVLLVLMYFSGQGEEAQRPSQRAHED